MKNKTLLALGAVTLATALSATSSTAHACGGFFCNRQAIDQSGENILFVQNDDGTVTTVVQIFYQGPSEEFAWILPVPAEPTVSVGTDALFQALSASTAPRFTLRSETVGTCRDEPSCPYWGGRFEGDDFDAAGAGPPSAEPAAPDDGVEVLQRANVGPFDMAVLASGSGDALREWLSDNGYLIPEAAGAELDHYVGLDHYFVALRLQKDRSAGEIQPIVLRSSNDEPCIPIRLTRIAATPDMPITAYFLGEQRARPMNYMLIEPDLDDEGLWLGSTRYLDSVTSAVDGAGGHAFVTDFAGDTPELSLLLEDIEDLRSVDDPAAFLSLLRSRGFSGDSQLLGILLRHIPPPEEYSADPMTFYNCLVGGWCAIDVPAYAVEIGFLGTELVDALDAAILAPRRAAQEMVASQPHLTRLFTTMSADEMTIDPQFMTSSELSPDYSNVHEAVRRYECSPEYFHWTAPRKLVLPSGREVVETAGIPYRGTDTEYCSDRYSGDFYPGAPEDRLIEVAAERELTAGGGGVVCSVRPGATGYGTAGVLGLLALGFVVRRRRSRG